jgi:hypothetical protein
MNASQFYAAFLEGWESARIAHPLKRLAGRTLKWKAALPPGTVTFAFATNPKTAGLWPHVPCEFRLTVRWDHGVGDASRADGVAWFQYATDDDARSCAALERCALEKYLAQPGKELLRGVYAYASDPALLPRANFEEFSHSFDEADARAWGQWYGARMDAWLGRFVAAPEAHEDWCWRVLWPHLERKT